MLGVMPLEIHSKQKYLFEYLPGTLQIVGTMMLKIEIGSGAYHYCKSAPTICVFVPFPIVLIYTLLWLDDFGNILQESET